MILIADSGSTKTHWRLVDSSNTITQFQTQGFNPFLQTTDEISGELKTNLLPLLYEESAQKVKHIYFYGAGCSTPEKCSIVSNALKQFFPNALLEVNHDLLAAARAVCGNKPGIAAILGTGSNTCYYNGESIVENVRSQGYLLGDEGSGMHIGKTFIKAYLDNEIPEDIKYKFEKKYSLSFDDILENIYKKPFPNRFLASFSKFVFENKEDKFVSDIIYKCIEMFFDKQVCKYKNHKEVEVSFVGSVAYYYNSFIKQIATKKGLQVGVIIESPIAALTQYHIEREEK